MSGFDDTDSAGPNGRGRPVRILLVEDNPADVRLTREMLRDSKVRNDLLVAHSAEEDILKSYDQYANDYVTEPIDLDEISRVVHSIDEFWLQVVRLPGDAEEAF